VDRIPVSAWWHDFGREWSPAGLAQAALEAYRTYGWDFIKLNPRATYYGEALGARYQRQDGRQPQLVQPAFTSVADLAKVQPVDVSDGPYGEQVEALRAVVRALGGEAPVIQTVFCPLAVISRASSPDFVRNAMAESPGNLQHALEAVAETLAAYVRLCLEAGAAGIFFATVEWGSADLISPEEHSRFARPFDLRVLEAAQGAPFNVLHVCRAHNHLPRLLDYPVSVFHWDAHGPGNPSVAAIAQRTPKALMGGVSHETTMKSGSPAEVVNEARRAIIEAGRRRFLLAPGCAVHPETPEKNLRALVEAAKV
jgi:uroporphyrinogen decarboxylase